MRGAACCDLPHLYPLSVLESISCVSFIFPYRDSSVFCLFIDLICLFVLVLHVYSSEVGLFSYRMVMIGHFHELIVVTVTYNNDDDNVVNDDVTEL